METGKWRKSSKSTENGGACVELAEVGRHVGVRDSKRPEGGKLLIDRAEARAFSERIKSL